MNAKARKIRVGLFAIITAALLAIVLVTFAGMRFWENHDEYKIVFHGSVMGLEKGARVYLNGTRVGSVSGIAVSKDDIGDVIVTIGVSEGTPIHANTEAMLQFAGITGLKVLDLRNGTNDSPRMPPGSTIARGEALLDRLEGRAQVLADQSAQLMERANRIVGQLDGVDEIVRNLADAAASLKDMVAENRTALKKSLSAIQDTANSATAIFDGQLPQLLANADSLISDVKGVVHRNDAQLRTAVFDLRQASRTFKDLARKVRQRPSRLLFSKPASDRRLP